MLQYYQTFNALPRFVLLLVTDRDWCITNAIILLYTLWLRKFRNFSYTPLVKLFGTSVNIRVLTIIYKQNL